MSVFSLGGKEARETNVIYKYLLGSLILTFPICSEDNIRENILKGLAGLPIYSLHSVVSYYDV